LIKAKRFKGSKVQKFKGSKVQRFKGSIKIASPKYLFIIKVVKQKIGFCNF